MMNHLEVMVDNRMNYRNYHYADNFHRAALQPILQSVVELHFFISGYQFRFRFLVFGTCSLHFHNSFWFVGMYAQCAPVMSLRCPRRQLQKPDSPDSSPQKKKSLTEAVMMGQKRGVVR